MGLCVILCVSFFHNLIFPFCSPPLLLPTSSQQSQVKESSQAPQMDVGGEEGGGGGVSGGGGGGGDGDVAARYERDLVHKLKLLRHELSLQQPQAGHCRIEVSREEIFEVSAGGSGGNTEALAVNIK